MLQLLFLFQKTTMNFQIMQTEHFVTDFIKIYGKQHASHNIHSLLHQSKNEDKYGPLVAYSAFKFENFMQKVKKLIRKASSAICKTVI